MLGGDGNIYIFSLSRLVRLARKLAPSRPTLFLPSQTPLFIPKPPRRSDTPAPHSPFKKKSGHEYTESNAAFALSVEPSNPKLVQRVQEIKTLRSQSLPTVPSILGLEKLTNPFLRGDLSKEIRDNVGSRGEGESGAEVFGKIRKAKDKFRGSL